MPYWISYKWYMPSTLLEYKWEYPLYLLGIPVILILFLFKQTLFSARIQRYEVAFLKKNLLKNNWAHYAHHMLQLPLLLCIVNALIALARPQLVDEKVEITSKVLDLYVLFDVSESMQIQDLHPSRIEAAKRILQKFISAHSHYRTGIIIFASDAYCLSPATLDRSALLEQVQHINSQMLEHTGTAIGNAIGMAVNKLSESNSVSKIALLLTDGENNSGMIDPITAAKLAYAANIKVYCIGLGKEGEVKLGTDSTGNPIMIQSHLDEPLLKQIAEITHAKYFRATDNHTLNEIFTTIEKLEKHEIVETRFKDTKDYYIVYLRWSCLFLLLWMVMKTSNLNNYLQD
ncbi:MAG: VWA domain-containing protein [Cytophagaceae bacterium]|nr:VWA domain-containing protein [Cytophagaceae bacterium]MDW8455512.1 VWA domain-containing protein [Cytophagaceae bacterium]